MNLTKIIFNKIKLNVLPKIFLFVGFFYILNIGRKIQLFQNYRLNNTKVCICTLGKNENKYITEFVDHYKNYGVDKIYLYDNNDIDGERFEDAIGKYIHNKYVQIIDWRGIKGKSVYYGIMDSCYQTNHDQYDWLIFYELDEFLYLKKYQNIKKFLTNKKFDECDSIQLNWVHMSDNNQIFYENKPLHDRFPQKGKNVVKNKENKLCYVKTIVRGHLNNITINHNHILSEKLKSCDGYGKKSQLSKITTLNPDYEFNFIRHYYSKSIQEFIEKLNRGDLMRGNAKNVTEFAIKKFFYINEITMEKIEYLRKHLGNHYNLSKYIDELNQKD